jgi:hypothetical protein
VFTVGRDTAPNDPAGAVTEPTPDDGARVSAARRRTLDPDRRPGAVVYLVTHAQESQMEVVRGRLTRLRAVADELAGLAAKTCERSRLVTALQQLQSTIAEAMAASRWSAQVLPGRQRKNRRRRGA